MSVCGSLSIHKFFLRLGEVSTFLEAVDKLLMTILLAQYQGIRFKLESEKLSFSALKNSVFLTNGNKLISYDV